jgi:hypothetical protein
MSGVGVLFFNPVTSMIFYAFSVLSVILYVGFVFWQLGLAGDA